METSVYMDESRLPRSRKMSGQISGANAARAVVLAGVQLAFIVGCTDIEDEARRFRNVDLSPTYIS